MFKFNVEYKINIRKKIDHDKDQFIEKMLIENVESKSKQFNFLSMNENDPNINNDKSESAKKRRIE
ncbi:28693_t:CDS:1, partial [Gigaspora margarita]